MLARLRPYLPAIALALLLGAAWTLADWSRLSARMLPDTDDAMRLQQVRDWIGGQALEDVSQHRLAGGMAIHWSRIPDLALAAIILALRPFAGQGAAEIAAVVAVPILSFVALLLLVRSIAGVLAPRAATVAVVLAALSYPASALFLPGRIDHHALQLLMVLIQLRALIAPESWRSGAVAGVAVAIGAAIGLETLPFALVTGAIIVVERLRGTWRADERQAGFGLALAGALLLLLPLAGHGGACDTIGSLAPATIAAALTLAALAGITRHRLPLLVASAAALAVLAWPAARPCLSGPYATVDPLVARLWLAQVGEAQPLFAAPFAQALAYAGLLVAGLAASGWLAWKRGGAWWWVIAYQTVAAIITLAQLRGAHVGAALAVLPLATLLAEARQRGRMPQVLALWIAGAGLTYPLVAGAIAPKAVRAAAPASCDDVAVLHRLAALPPGRVMAGIDRGAYIIAGTPQAAVAAPYHRNNAGNAAMYRFFLSPAAAARRIAAEWQVDYVVACPGDLGTVRAGPDAIGGGARPTWLVPIAQQNGVAAIFTIDRRLSDAPPAR